MDFSKLSSNEKLMLYGAVAAVLGGLIGGISSIIWISVIAGIAVAVVLLLPQFSPQTRLPGTRASLLVAIGGVGAVAAALAFLMVLVDIGFWFEVSAIRTILFLIGVAGGLLMGWIAWQEFKAEGGTFNLGTATSSAAPSEGGTPGVAAPSSDVSASPPPASDPAAQSGTASAADDDRSTA